MQFAEVEVATSTFQFLAFGAYAGLVIDAKYYNGTPKQIHDTSFNQTLLRFLLVFILTMPFIFAPMKVGNYLNYLIVRGVVFYFLPPLLCFTLMFGYSKLLFAKMRLVSDDNTQTKLSQGYYIVRTDSDLLSVSRANSSN